MTSFHHAWFFLAIAFFTMVVSQSLRLAFGVFVTPWETTFQTTRSDIGLIASISALMFGSTQPIIGWLTDRRGARLVVTGGLAIVVVTVAGSAFATSLWQIVLLYGMIGSVGFGACAVVPVAAAVTRWFTARRGLALGIISTGYAIGQLVFVPVAVLLVESLGWRTTLLLQAGFLGLVVLPIVALWFRSSPEAVGLAPLGGWQQGGAADASGRAPGARRQGRGWAYRTRAFWFLAIPYFVCGFTSVGLIDTHFVPYAQSEGYSPTIVAVAMSLVATGNLIGCLGVGYLLDRWSRRHLLAGLFALRALTLVFAVALVRDPLLLAVFALTNGLTDIATIAPTSSLTADYFGRGQVGSVFAWVNLSHQFGTAVGASIYARIFDGTGSYHPGFLLAAALLLGVATTLTLALPKRPRPMPALEMR